MTWFGWKLFLNPNTIHHKNDFVLAQYQNGMPSVLGHWTLACITSCFIVSFGDLARPDLTCMCLQRNSLVKLKPKLSKYRNDYSTKVLSNLAMQPHLSGSGTGLSPTELGYTSIYDIMIGIRPKLLHVSKHFHFTCGYVQALWWGSAQCKHTAILICSVYTVWSSEPGRHYYKYYNIL